MIIHVLAISIMGIGIVFAFLFIIYLILTGFKYLDKREDYIYNQESSTSKDKVRNITEEKIISIITAISDYHQNSLKNGKIIINQIGGTED